MGQDLGITELPYIFAYRTPLGCNSSPPLSVRLHWCTKISDQSLPSEMPAILPGDSFRVTPYRVPRLHIKQFPIYFKQGARLLPILVQFKVFLKNCCNFGQNRSIPTLISLKQSSTGNSSFLPSFASIGYLSKDIPGFCRTRGSK